MDPNPRLLGDDISQLYFNDDSLRSRLDNRFVIGVKNPDSPESRELIKFNLFNYLKSYKPKLWDSLSNPAFKTSYNRGSGPNLEYLTIQITNCTSFNALIVFEQTNIDPHSGQYTIIHTYACDISYQDGVLTHKEFGSEFSVSLTSNRLQVSCDSGTLGFYNVVCIEAYGTESLIGAMDLETYIGGQGTIVSDCIQHNGKLTESSFNADPLDSSISTLDNNLPSMIFFDRVNNEFLTSSRLEMYGTLAKKYQVIVDLDRYQARDIFINTKLLEFNGIKASDWTGDLDIVITAANNEILSVSATPIDVMSPRSVKFINDTIYPITLQYLDGTVLDSIIIGPEQILIDNQVDGGRSLSLVSKNSGEYANILYKPLWTYVPSTSLPDVPSTASRFYQSGVSTFIPKLKKVICNNTAYDVNEMYVGLFNYSNIYANSIVIPIGNNQFLHSDIEKVIDNSGTDVYELLTDQQLQTFINGYKKLESTVSKQSVINWSSNSTYLPWNFNFSIDSGTLSNYNEKVI